jgi:hypothetical protein
MNSGLSSLHRILKDETRSRIILLLNERGSLSYTDLMNSLEIVNTGTLNYHLKVLGDLLSKNESGLYVLTDKGKLASQLLLKFSEENNAFGANITVEKRVWEIASVVSIVYIAVVSALYFFGRIDFVSFSLNILTGIMAVILGYFAYKIRVIRTKWPLKRQMLGQMISYVIAGAGIGAVAFFFLGALLIIGLATVFRSAGIVLIHFSFTDWATASPIVGVIIGGVLGYLIYKRNESSRQE